MKIAILGSTGSIGRQTLDVIDECDDFSVVALSAYENVQLLAEQIKKYRPLRAAIISQAKYQQLKELLPSDCKTEILSGEDANSQLAAMDEVELVVVSTVGISGLKPLLAAIEADKEVALATKETLVAAGNIVMKSAAAKNLQLRPIDSEHSAIFQSISNQRAFLEKIILTSSGGPLRQVYDFKDLSVQKILAHPTWKMGRKITVDSATLMNKGFEVIEASFLFNTPPERIEVVVHPQSVVHSLVEFVDAAVIAQLSPPDMRLAIQYALSYPNRIPHRWCTLDLPTISSLTFEKPDLSRFPALSYAYEALKIGGTLPAALNAADEEVVRAFLNEEIPFTAISEILYAVLEKQEPLDDLNFENIEYADSEARKFAKMEIMKRKY